MIDKANSPNLKKYQRKPSSRVPALRHHKASGRGYVVLNGQAVYLGKFGTSKTSQKYHQTIAEWIASGRQLHTDPEHITIRELIARFWIYAEQYYRTVTDGRVKELEQFRLAMRPLKELYADTRAIDFGPRALKGLRQRMVAMGWSRPYVNKQINRIRHMYKWAVSDELVPGSVLHALKAVPGLRRGRSDAAEPEAVKPVAIEMVEAIQPFVSQQVWAMIQLQLFTAARPGEVCRMRPCDIDRDGNIWVYALKRHKTAWHGHSRTIWIGPRGQEVLAPFLLREPNSYCFSPAEAEAERRKRMSEQRVTPLSCGNTPGSNVKNNPQRSAGERYTTCAYRRAIARACDWAFPLPQPLVKKQKTELKAWRKAHRWHPHQLRHNAATNLRKDFGLEAARIILGHRSAAITEVYAELDQQKAIEAMLKIG